MLQELNAINVAIGFPLNTETLNPEILLSLNVDQIYISIMGDDIEETKRFVEQEFIRIQHIKT